MRYKEKGKRLKSGLVLNLLTFTFCLAPFHCASAAWREGFKDSNTLHLVGEGHAEGDMPELQARAMAQKAAVMDAVSHWPKYCPGHDAGEDLDSFHVSNQKKWQYRCEAKSCRARVVIEKKNLRKNCNP